MSPRGHRDGVASSPRRARSDGVDPPSAGAATIFDFDDDNAPLSPSILDGLGPRSATRVATAPGASKNDLAPVNPYPWFGAPRAWPRGLPLDALNSANATLAPAAPAAATLGVVQGLAQRDPDVDAIYRLAPRAALPLPFFFDAAAKDVVAAGPGGRPHTSRCLQNEARVFLRA